jgi:hypothetical protein
MRAAPLLRSAEHTAGVPEFLTPAPPWARSAHVPKATTTAVPAHLAQALCEKNGFIARFYLAIAARRF